MALTVDLTGIPRTDVRQGIERAVRDYVGYRAVLEDWKVRIYADFSNLVCTEVIVEGPGHKRNKSFYEVAEKLPQAIRDWLMLYPLR